MEEYKGALEMGAHQSSPLTAYNGRGDLEMSLQQAVCPWDTDTFLSFRMGEEGMGSIPISAAGGGMALFDLLAKEIGDLTRAYPALYGERFGYVADATSSGADPTKTQDVEEEWDTLPGVTDTYPSTSVDAEEPDDDEPEPQDVVVPGKLLDWEVDPLESLPYRLTVNGRVAVRGTLQEVQAAVAKLVTTRLAAAPERMAPEAHAINALFNEGHVARALAARGEWFTVVDGQGPDPQHIRVTKE
ncbi:hypothetical protein OG762_52365 (plasmid) [Streptomyces sp. NBC_01136]|uniref:hypothetical protein n=1 Tax=Streptomyces sp. NBC_01136 TaxID=2903754 RepID=UPI0037DD664A|nr:hypothetical protein OG762_52365 [Streptomyces sp. NBC_01136]